MPAKQSWSTKNNTEIRIQMNKMKLPTSSFQNNNNFQKSANKLLQFKPYYLYTMKIIKLLENLPQYNKNIQVF